MKKHELYSILDTLSGILNLRKEGVSTGLLYNLIKNKKILLSLILIILQMFNVKNIKDYLLFETKKNLIISKYQEAHKDLLTSEINQNRLAQHLMNVNLLILLMIKQDLLKLFYKLYTNITNKRKEFLNLLSLVKLIPIKLEDINEVKLTAQLVLSLFNLIIE